MAIVGDEDGSCKAAECGEREGSQLGVAERLKIMDIASKLMMICAVTSKKSPMIIVFTQITACFLVTPPLSAKIDTKCAVSICHYPNSKT